jgi:transposase
VDTKAKRRNKRWPEALKREIVAATLQPGASVSVVARQYDVNANQVFSWRRRYGAAQLQSASPSPASMPTLVPVTIVAEDQRAAGAVPRHAARLGGTQPDGHAVVREVRAASAVEPSG